MARKKNKQPKEDSENTPGKPGEEKPQLRGDSYLDYRLRRIDGHDGNNVEQGVDLVEWTRVDGVNAEDWVKWKVHYGSRGHISFKANNNELPGSAEDKKYDDPLYFGLYAKAGENGDTEARFDSFRIAAE